MRKFYKIIILLVAFVFLTTYNPGHVNVFPKKTNFFFKIKNIEIINNRIVDKSFIIAKLSNLYQKNILSVSRNEIEKPLESIDFLEKIEVKKKYPNTLIITVYETKPVAILFKKKNRYFLDNLSNLINFNKSIVTNNLPNIFGEGAEEYFVDFLNELKDNKFPIEKIKNYYYFQIGRWDLQLLNDQIIKFPENKIKATIRQCVELLNREDFKNYNVIDLRIHGKIVVE